MLTSEDGPYLLFRKLRNSMGFVHDDFGHIIGRPDGNILSCIWCLSVWMTVVLMWMPPVVVWIFAASTIAIIVNEKLIS